MKYIVYKTINLVNKKVYIGVHRTNNPDIFDGYLGCGLTTRSVNYYKKSNIPFHRAVIKYGIQNFVRNTLKVFDNMDDALLYEAKIVTDDFIKSQHTYNATPGGGAPPLLTKRIFQFDIFGNFIKTWKSETEINLFYNSKVSFSEIINKKRSFAGYFWSFNDTINISEYSKELNRGFISQYSLDGQLVKVFKNASEAANDLNVNRNSIVRSVFSKCPLNSFYFLKSDVDINKVIQNNENKITYGRIKVYRYLSNGEFDTKYNSILQASKQNGISYQKMRKVVYDNLSYNGYHWSFIKNDNYFNINYLENSKPECIIAQYDLNNNLIKYWYSVKECTRKYKYAIPNCNGMRKTAHNYIFKYVNTKDIV